MQSKTEVNYMADRMVLLVFSGSYDKLVGMSVLVSGAVALDMEVDIYLMLWGAYAFKKDTIGKDMEVSEHQSLAEKLKEGMEKAGLKPWFESLKELKKMGTVRIHACGAAAKTWDADLSNLEFVDDIVGATEMVSALSEAKIALFI